VVEDSGVVVVGSNPTVKIGSTISETIVFFIFGKIHVDVLRFTFGWNMDKNCDVFSNRVQLNWRSISSEIPSVIFL
jgi:hypothetical protein